VEVTRCLLEFHEATPTRETLKQAISTGNAELIKMMRERLPDAELHERRDLRAVAAEFHQREVVGWLLGDASVFEWELLAVFAVEHKLADAVMVAFQKGFRPWWHRTRDFALKWRVGAEMEFVAAPEGFWCDGGWWRSKVGGESPLPPLGSEAGGRWGLQVLVRRDKELTGVVFPANVTAIGRFAFDRCAGLAQIEIPSSVTTIGEFAFRYCTSLRQLEIPQNVIAIGEFAFDGCSGLRELQIPRGVKTIGKLAFRNCSGLTELQMPSSFSSLGNGVFQGVTKLERLTLLGSPLSPAVARMLRGCLNATAKVIGSARVMQRFGRLAIAAA
jgi:hypothetical protein